MTDQERDAAAASGAEGAEDVADDEELDEADELEGDEGEYEDEDEGEEGEELAPAITPAARPGVAVAPGGRRLRGQPRAAAPVPSVSERAVRVDDRFSGWYVMAIVAVFVLILLNAVLIGHAGFVTGLMATPTPVVTESPSVPASTAPSASSAPSASAAASGSAGPSASASASASAAPASASPSGS